MDTLKSKILQRCGYIEQAIVNCYSVTGPYQVAVNVIPAGAGEVKLNTIWLPNYIWTGNYFGGVSMTFEQHCLNTTQYTFDHWQFKHHSPSPNNLKDTVTINFTQADTVIAYYKLKDVVTNTTTVPGGSTTPTATTTPTVVKENVTTVIFPTAFTPNGDGHNDILFPLGAGNVKSISIEVWNRWGQQVFYTNDATKGWDGNFKGAEAQTGVYAYLIKYVNIEGESKTAKGNITLLR